MLAIDLLLMFPLHGIWIGLLATYSAFHVFQVEVLFGQGEAEASQESQGLKGEMHFFGDV